MSCLVDPGFGSRSGVGEEIIDPAGVCDSPLLDLGVRVGAP